MLTWSVIGLLVVGVYGQRVVGMLLIDINRVGRKTTALLNALPVAIICAVIAEQTFTTNGAVDIDARVLGVGAAIFCAWRKFPMYVIIGAAAASTALFRLIT